MAHRLTVAFCTYNRVARLPALIQALRDEVCPIPFDILVVNNKSTDETPQLLANLARQPGATLRFVREVQQGIVHARNRAIEECLSLNSDYMLFIDDDELPQPGLLTTTVDALEREKAECVGGRVTVVFPKRRPKWLDEELLGFLAEINYGNESFWIKDRSTPLWTANIAYRMEIFIKNPTLRFDSRYNRSGQEVGGGEDAILFRTMLEKGIRLRYRPDMVVSHHIDEWRIKRRYFLKLHFVSGRRYGQFETGEYSPAFYGVPLFMFRQAIIHWVRTGTLFLTQRPGLLRQAMNSAHAMGCIWGRILRHRKDKS